jgi:hypothetical protein
MPKFCWIFFLTNIDKIHLADSISLIECGLYYTALPVEKTSDVKFQSVSLRRLCQASFGWTAGRSWQVLAQLELVCGFQRPRLALIASEGPTPILGRNSWNPTWVDLSEMWRVIFDFSEDLIFCDLIAMCGNFFGKIFRADISNIHLVDWIDNVTRGRNWQRRKFRVCAFTDKLFVLALWRWPIIFAKTFLCRGGNCYTLVTISRIWDPIGQIDSMFKV